MPRKSTPGKSNSQRKKLTRAQQKAQQEAQLEETRKSKREVLAKKTDDELREMYVQHLIVDPEEGATREDMIEAIVEATIEVAPRQHTLDQDEEERDTYFGNKDADEEHEIPASITSQDNWEDMVIVRQTPKRLVEGSMVKLEAQAFIQGYEPEMFERLERQKYFSEAKLDVQILHDPR